MPQRSTVRSERIRAIAIASVLAGATRQQIARAIGEDVHSVRRWVMPYVHRRVADMAHRCLAGAGDGMPLTALADRIGVSRQLTKHCLLRDERFRRYTVDQPVREADRPNRIRQRVWFGLVVDAEVA